MTPSHDPGRSRGVAAIRAVDARKPWATAGRRVFDRAGQRASERRPEKREKRRRLNKSARRREASRLAALASAPPARYDRVLVDADCTTDGSRAHVAKMVTAGRVEELFAPDRVAALCAAQGALLRSGFALLKPGGALVYSTCSLATAQNEGVLRRAEIPQRSRSDAAAAT